MKKDELSKEEVQILENRRKNQESVIKCSEEIKKVLEDFNAELMVDPQSPIGNPQIFINIR